jgi:uncharacterized protein (TIRG00374 family)
MNKKRFVIYALLLAILAVLVYLQFRSWKNFDWATFWSQGKTIDPRHILGAVGIIYVTYVLRALRWKIFLRPVRKQGSWLGLIAPTLVGFTGLALLGRPGELIRPFLIARREGLNFSSQMAAWTVERIFDIAGFAVLLCFGVFLPGTAVHLLPNYRAVRVFAFLFATLATGMSFAAILIARFGERVSVWVEKRLSHLAAGLGRRIAERLREFHQGLDTIHDPLAFLQITAVSLALWAGVALSYFEVVRAYGAPLQHITISKIFPLMGSSMVGSLIQLPGVGGGSQLATISALQHIFNTTHELAASCGILLWLVTFVSVVPAGLVLAHYERLSLRKLSEESSREEEASVLEPPQASI